MSGFEERLIEDLGHEISDAVIAGEELLKSSSESGESIQFARDFRGLLATLEVGIRLLQWDDFAFFLAQIGTKFDAAFFLNEPVEGLREKMRATVQVLLRIHEGFDGVRFSADQLSSWSAEIDGIWEESVESRPEPDTETPISREAFPTEALPGFDASDALPEATLKTDSKNVAALAVEYRGQEFLFPVDRIEGLLALDPVEFQNLRDRADADKFVEIRGVTCEWAFLRDFRSQKKNVDETKTPPHEVVLVKTKSEPKAIPVDRVIGFRQTTAEDFLDEPVKYGEYVRLKSRGHLASSWLWRSAG